ncbi:MAG TPA: helicase-related protein, partial [Methyloradius sp.]|nr:helicase-related protein [Methyloradius sp.]
SQVIVFTKTKLTASRLAKQLQREGISADAIHGDKSQLERMQALEAFKQGTIAILIATDVAARGLDIDHLPMVINYEIPSAPEDYVHRIGRTGRAGKSGIAISLVAPEEEKYLKEIEKLIKREITPEPTFVTEAPASSQSSSRESVSDNRSSRNNNVRDETRTSSPRPAPKKKSTDEWFDKPYEPSSSANNAQQLNRVSSKPKTEVAALLGGLQRRN